MQINVFGSFVEEREVETFSNVERRARRREAREGERL